MYLFSWLYNVYLLSVCIHVKLKYILSTVQRKLFFSTFMKACCLHLVRNQGNSVINQAVCASLADRGPDCQSTGFQNLGNFVHYTLCLSDDTNKSLVLSTWCLCQEMLTIPCSSPCFLAGWGPSHLIASSTFIVNVLHFPLSSAVVFHSWLFVPALSRSRLTQSFHCSFGLPLLLLPPSSAFHALF